MITKRPKFVFVTGGVVSSIGKGLAAASIGALMEARGLRVTHVKLDPYINVDPGTMSPYQHGEVFVTDDGAETDLDLGHYERFTTRAHDAREQLHDRPHLRGGHHQGAARRVPRRDGAGDPAHHRRDQSAHHARSRRASTSRSSRSAAPSATSSRCRSSRRSASCKVEARPAERGQRARHARAVHRDRGRAQDQADAALGEGDARDRHPARHPDLPLRPAARRAT